MLLVCFFRAAEFGVPDLFLPSRPRALQDEGRLCVNEKVPILLSLEMKTSFMDRGLLTRTNHYEVGSLSALLGYTWINEFDLLDSKALSW